MAKVVHGPHPDAMLSSWRRGALAMVLALAVLNLIGWATGVERLTRFAMSWPAMVPWSALLLIASAAAVLAQSEGRSTARMWIGSGLAATSGVLAVVFITEYATGTSFGLDVIWFADGSPGFSEGFPGRPSLLASSSFLLLSVAIALTRMDRQWSQVVWSLCLATAVVLVIVPGLGDAFEVDSLMGDTAAATAAGLMLLVSATTMTRPDRNPLAWLLARPDRWPLIRMAGILAGLPLLVWLSRLVFLVAGVGTDEAWVLSIAVGTVFVGAGAFYFGQREQGLLLEKELLSSQNAEIERERFRAVVGNSPSAISVRDLQHRYTMANEAFCQMFGRKSVDDVIGRAEDEILSPDALERSRRGADRLLAGENFFEEESIQLGPQNIWLMTQQFPLRSSSGVNTEFVTIRTDITHRKRAEQEAADRILWEERIRAAIDDGRLLVYSHPIVDIATATTVEEELLVRLRAVDEENVRPPSEFLPYCERYGLMPVIDRYMVECAIDLARVGRCVSVNITGQTIGDPTTLEQIFDALAAATPDTLDKIIFEITETIALGSPAKIKEFSRGVRKLGCRVALDDFGTGYGTFTELRHLELDMLKIDQSFVRNMLADGDDERTVKTIIFVAHAYGLSTVAEGVESQRVLDKLAELGVNRAQGYLFGKPTPVGPRTKL